MQGLHIVHIRNTVICTTCTMCYKIPIAYWAYALIFFVIIRILLNDCSAYFIVYSAFFPLIFCILKQFGQGHFLQCSAESVVNRSFNMFLLSTGGRLGQRPCSGSSVSRIIDAGPAAGTSLAPPGQARSPQARPSTHHWVLLELSPAGAHLQFRLNDPIVICNLLLRQHLISLLRASERGEPEKVVDESLEALIWESGTLLWHYNDLQWPTMTYNDLQWKSMLIHCMNPLYTIVFVIVCHCYGYFIHCYCYCIPCYCFCITSLLLLFSNSLLLYSLYIVFGIVIVFESILIVYCILYFSIFIVFVYCFMYWHCYCSLIHCYCYCKLAYILLLYIVFFYCHCYCNFDILLLFLWISIYIVNVYCFMHCHYHCRFDL